MKSKKNLKLLLINPYGIGDALFISPIIRTLKKAYPDGKIGLLLGSRTRALFENNPDVNIIFDYNKDIYKSLNFIQKISFHLKLNQHIRKESFDVCIDFSNTDEYTFLAKWAWKIPRRIGFQYKNRGRHLTDKIRLEKDFSRYHVVSHYYQLLSPLEISSPLFEHRLYFYPAPLPVTPIVTQKPLVCILPGGGESWGKEASYKLWPVSHYITLVNQLIKEAHVDIALVGGKIDAPLCQEIETQLSYPIYNLCGKTSLKELADVLAQADLVVGTESGPLHLATAMDKKAILIYGPVDPLSYGPYSDTRRQVALFEKLPCQPCYKEFRIPKCSNHLCLKELSPERVFKAAKELLTSKPQ